MAACKVKARKKVKAKRTPPRPRRVHGEDWLDRLETLAIKLENGDKATFDIAAEVSVPRDASARELRRLEATSAGRLAFWSAQVARQRREVGKVQRKLLKIEAEADLVVRKYVVCDTDYAPTERAIRSHTDTYPEVKDARLKVAEAKYVLEVLEVVRDAVRTRSFVLGRLLTTEAKAVEG